MLGEMLDAALDRMNTFGRIIACGGISQVVRAPKSQSHGEKSEKITA